ncbi:MAG: nicotinate-nucleotide adenylyltransferase, partial [Clostridiales bacterium]
RHFQLDQILFLSTGRPPHKRGQHTATPQQRYEMTLLAVGGQPDFRVSALETNRQGYSYTWDTLQYFREEFPQSQLFFITGADAILDISSWKNAHQLTKLCTFIAIARPGFDLAGLSRLPMQISRHIQSLKVPALAISSTEIR